jgi:MFS transporter, LPLT family, lysophospholipid transporter
MMPKGFYWLIAAQFLSGLADSSLLIVGIAFLSEQGYPAWWAPVLKLTFTFSYVALAPWVGHVADAFIKRDLMILMNVVKFAGAIFLLLGVHPFLCFAVVGFGASVYAPAKYGLVTESVLPKLLVRANGWLEVTVVLSVLMGVGIGGWLVSSWWGGLWSTWGLFKGPGWHQSYLVDSRYLGALTVVLIIYVAAGLVNAGVMRRPPHFCHPQRERPIVNTRYLKTFMAANRSLWLDPLGGLAIAVTTIFWGMSAVMQFAIIEWAQLVLDFSLSGAAYLQATVALGVVVGAGVSAARITLSRSVLVLFAGVLLGVVVALAALTVSIAWAVMMLWLVGFLGGTVVVPMNALLQYRGHRKLRPGLSIAVQGFNENLATLVLLAAYAGFYRDGVGLVSMMVILGILLSFSMGILLLKNRAWFKRALRSQASS